MISNKLIICCLLLSIFAGKEFGQRSATAIAIDRSESLFVPVAELELNPSTGLVYFKDKPFTGTKVVHNAFGKAVEKVQYLAGKKHGYHRKWFADGQLGYEAMLVNGRLDGVAHSWWSNGNMRSESHYQAGRLHGQQRQWYQSGALFKERNIVMGKEEGIQKAWRENGKIYNNYQAKNGRIFGLKRANLCFQLEDEVVQHED